MPFALPPFENRWTSGDEGRRWLLRLDREGLQNVRACYAEHQARAGDDPHLFDDIPVMFIRDWLAWHDRCDALATRNRHRVVVALLLVAILALGIIGWRVWLRV